MIWRIQWKYTVYISLCDFVGCVKLLVENGLFNLIIDYLI